MRTRSPGALIRAPLRAYNYRSLVHSVGTFPAAGPVLWRYVTNRGTYPYRIRIRTPIGEIAPTLYSFHDIRTVNEVFNRLEYRATAEAHVVVDVGANIGISASYFATRSPTTRVYCYEPSPINIDRLRINVEPFGKRVRVEQTAVGATTGRLLFNAEPIGRYGGLITPDYTPNYTSEHPIEVDVLAIDDVLASVLDHEGQIDILKIDIEGIEIPTLRAASPDLLIRIRTIYLEGEPATPILPGVLDQKQEGQICVLRPVSAPP
jgi:FkbM family methyltransferase